MKMPKMHLFVTSLWVISLQSPIQAQRGEPRIGYAFPAGGQRGTEFPVTLGGQFLGEPTKVVISGTGVNARVVERIQPMSQKEFSRLRERLLELQQKKPKDQSTNDEIAELRQKIAQAVRRPATPAIAELVQLLVSIDPSAVASERELRLVTTKGLTNPLIFWVGELPEFSAEAARPVNEFAIGPRPRAGQRSEEFRNPRSVQMPITVNGQITPGEVDRYEFHAQKGQHVVASLKARNLIPYLADAVPGWFQATLAIRDRDGGQIAFVDDFHDRPDPVLDLVIPEDGRYIVEVRDALYRGREDFVYRLTLGELPFVAGLFPLGGPIGRDTRVELIGWNLPQTTLTLSGADQSPGGLRVPVPGVCPSCNIASFVFDELPDCLEVEPNNIPTEVQSLELPIVVNGRINRPGDTDLFCFDGKAGDVVVAEVSARRLGSPLDSLLRLLDSAQNPLSVSDDYEDSSAGLVTHHADSWLRVQLPADGRYFVALDDAQHRGGTEYAYRLRIGPPQPDFSLRVVPSSITTPPGSTIPLTVHAFRKDGFDGDIELTLRQAPDGFALSGAQIPEGQNQVSITLTTPTKEIDTPTTLVIIGQAAIGPRTISHQVRPADDRTQAFAYSHLVPCQELRVHLVGAGPRRLSLKPTTPGRVKIPAGGATQLELAAGEPINLRNLRLELLEPSDGISVVQSSANRQTLQIVLQADENTVQPGWRGNLIFTAAAGRGGTGNSANPQANRRQTPGITLPAIPFEIVTP